MTGSTANANRSRRSSLQLQPQPQREVLAPLPSSSVRFLLRWKYFVLIPIALVYLFTLSVLTNRQNLAIQLEAEGGSESNGEMLLRSSPSSHERLHSNGVTLLFDALKRKTNEARFLPKPSASDGVATKCAFCEGERGIPNLDLVVPRTGGNTCGSIKSMAAGEMNGSDMCATLQKEENVCCPLSYSSTKTIFVISLQGTPGAHESNDGRLDLFKEKWRIACGSSSASTNIEHCPAPFDKRRGYGLTQAWIFCLWRARQLDEEAAIFLEDDARLFENSTQEFCDVNKRGELLSKLPSDTFVAFLGGHTWSYEDSAVPYRRVRNSYGTYGFLVPRNSIDDFHAALTHGLLHGSKDRKQNAHHNSLDPEPTFYRAAREYRKKIYAFNPLVIWHEGGYSNTWGKVRGNITGLETKKQGIKVSSGMTNTAHKISINSGHQRAVQEKDSKRLGGFATKCSFCEGERGIPNLDLVVPRTGGNTCGSIMSMAAGEMNESDICATLQKEENVCCPVPYVKSKASSSLDIFLNQQSIDYVPFKNGDWVAYQIRSELRLAQVFGVERGKNAITLRYLGPNTGSDRAVEKTVAYRPDLLQNHGEALLARTGTFANCSQTVENNTVVFREANERSATVVSCRTIKFAAEASSFVGKSGAVIVGVLSTSDNSSWRNAIRTTWAANSTVFFVIAGSWNDIKEEYHEYNDIIWIDMQESFRLITYKTSMFFQVVNMMASELNLSYSHALKTDDDSYVALGRLKQLVKREDPKHLDYWGQSDMKYVKPLRNPEHRYYESLDQYPEPYYPPYVSGSAILLSRKTVECVTKTMQEARFLDMEDVFLGVVNARCGVIPTHSKFVRVYRGSMKASRCATEHNKQEVTMKNKIIQHRILSPEDMVAHHESTKTDPFQFDAIPQPSSASPLDGTHELLGSLALQEMKEVESRAERKRAVTKPRLEFVHITKTGGSTVEHVAATVGITWGSCHYMKLEEVGCSSPDLPYEARDYQSYALTSPWHTPPKILKQYVDGSLYPYDDADLFTIVRNPYSRVMSEYYCPWAGFQSQPKYRRGIVHKKDPNDPKVMNVWVKSMVKRLGVAIDDFNAKKGRGKVMNRDSLILAQKHYVNQAEYVYDGDEMIVKHVVHYENLSSEFDALMKKYDINVTLPSKEEGVYSDAKKSRLSYTDLDPEAIALINEFAKVDFEKFGYQMVEKRFEENYSLEAKIIEIE